MDKTHCIVPLDPFKDDGIDMGSAVVALGVFDGMHIGHETLFSQARQHARSLGVPLIAVTFEKDPDEIFRKDDREFGKLLSNVMRHEMILDQIDGDVLSLPASAEVFALSPEQFLEALERSIDPCAVFIGSNFHFGAHAAGTVKDLAAWCGQHSCDCVSCELVEDGGEVVSSTRIRRELEAGRVAEAKRLLGGRPHSVCGTVVHGRGEGGGFGFATANLDLSGNEVMLPREGVYGGYAIVDGKRYPAAVNVGKAKSFATATAPVEAHLLEFEGDLYGKDICIEFEEWLREPRIFKDKTELIETIEDNIAWVREHLGNGD